MIAALVATKDKTKQINIFDNGQAGFSIKDMLDGYENIVYYHDYFGDLDEFMIALS